MRPANERLLLEAERLEGQNESLRRLIERNRTLVTRLRQTLSQAIAEQEAIHRENRPPATKAVP